MYWLVASETTSNCRINTKYFPFDIHRCIVGYSPEHAPNIIVESLFKQPIISPYSYPNADWHLTGHGIGLIKPPDRNLVVNSTNIIDETTRQFTGPQSGIVWEFEFRRNPSMMVNSWLLPFLVMMVTSNCVFLITLSGKTVKSRTTNVT